MNRVYILLVVAALFGIGSALKCYQCSDLEVSKDNCVGFQKNVSLQVNCSETENACHKLVREVKATNQTLVVRGCVNTERMPEECDKEDNQKKSACYVCKKDLCNTAAIPSTVSSLVYILPIALFLFTGSSK